MHETMNGSRSRRAVLTAGAAGAAAWLLGRVAAPEAARSASGDPLVLGQSNDATGFTTLVNNDAGVQVLNVTAPNAAVGIRADVGIFTGIFGSSTGDGISLWGANAGTGTGVNGTSEHGNGVAGSTSTGSALFGASGFGGGGNALKAVGPVDFSSAVRATIPAHADHVDVAIVFGDDSEQLDLTDTSKVVCTLMSNPFGRDLHYVSINPATNTFTVHMTGPVRTAIDVSCVVFR